jgi:hypothetical protein
MQAYDTFHVGSRRHTGMEPAADCGPHDTVHPASVAQVQHETSMAAPLSRNTDQGERTAMHPDRDDMEWHYCRSGRIG